MNPGQTNYPILPDPPLIQYYLLESPWQLMFLLMVCGLILIYQSLQTRKKKLAIIGGVFLVACIPLLITSSLVKTTRETVTDQARLLIKYTAPLEFAQLKSMLTSECKLYRGTQENAYTLAVPEIDTIGEVALKRIIQQNTITRLDASVDSPNAARTQLWLKTYAGFSPDRSFPPSSTRWEFHWTLHDGQWKVHTIRWIESEQPFSSLR